MNCAIFICLRSASHASSRHTLESRQSAPGLQHPIKPKI